MSDDFHGPYIVVLGDPITGLSFVGPFATMDAACEWADMTEDLYWLARLGSPNKRGGEEGLLKAGTPLA
jgi:hypothetical protein